MGRRRTKYDVHYGLNKTQGKPINVDMNQPYIDNNQGKYSDVFSIYQDAVQVPAFPPRPNRPRRGRPRLRPRREFLNLTS